MSLAAQIALAVLPWLVVAAVMRWRARGSRHLDDESATPPEPAPLVSVVIPARDEAHNVERCLRSVMATTYPRAEILVIDDHSTDGTGDLARRTASGDARVRVLIPPPLPTGWFGKSWACWSGAAAARGELILFTDADTTHAPDLLVRLVNAQRSQHADLISVGGRQEVGTFWERLLQPMVFTMLLARYGGTKAVTESRRAMDKIANGQCILVRRASYEQVGGHESVRDKVAEDLMLAQRFFRAGKHVALVIGLDQLSTRMYTSLGDLVRGWRKNIFAGAGDAVPFGVVGRRVILPMMLLLPWILVLLPPIVCIVALCGGVELSPIPPVAATLALVVLWAAIYRAFELRSYYAIIYPLGAVVMLYIVTSAIVRGRSVGWKGRTYQAR
jgi:chlorobactene glucosyltransferase